jgi:hypothetical protein
VVAVLDITLPLELVVPVVMEVVVTVVLDPLRHQMDRLAPEVVRVEWNLVEALNTEEDQELLLSDTMLNLSKTQD